MSIGARNTVPQLATTSYRPGSRSGRRNRAVNRPAGSAGAEPTAWLAIVSAPASPGLQPAPVASMSSPGIAAVLSSVSPAVLGGWEGLDSSPDRVSSSTDVVVVVGSSEVPVGSPPAPVVLVVVVVVRGALVG